MLLLPLPQTILSTMFLSKKLVVPRRFEEFSVKDTVEKNEITPWRFGSSPFFAISRYKV